MSHTFCNTTRGKRDDRDDDDSLDLPLLVPEKKPYRLHESEYRSRVMDYYLSGPIVAPEHYTDMVHAIRTAAPTDEVALYLNTSGGHVDTGIQLINAMRQSQATITTVLDGQAYSMGALLFLCGNNIVVGDNTMLMFHNYSSVLFGKGNEQLSEVVMAAKWFRKFMLDICVPFLSEQEVDDVLAGKDLWMDSEEILERLPRMVGTRAKDGTRTEPAEVREAAVPVNASEPTAGSPEPGKDRKRAKLRRPA